MKKTKRRKVTKKMRINFQPTEASHQCVWHSPNWNPADSVSYLLRDGWNVNPEPLCPFLQLFKVHLQEQQHIYSVCSHKRIKTKTGLILTPALLFAPVEKTDEGLIILSPIFNKENRHCLMHDLQVKKELQRPSENVVKSESRAATDLKMNRSPQPVNQTWRTEAQVDAWKGFAFTFMSVFSHTQKTLGLKFQSSNYLTLTD